MPTPKSTFTAPRDRKSGGLMKRCRRFNFVTEDPDTQEMLSHLYRTIFVRGGKLTVQTNGEDAEEYKFEITPR